MNISTKQSSMRNQYKLLSEKYKLVNESDKEDIMSGLGEIEQQEKKRAEDRQLMEDFIEKLKYVDAALTDLADLYNSNDARNLFNELSDAHAEDDFAGVEGQADSLEYQFCMYYANLKESLKDQIRHYYRNIS